MGGASQIIVKYSAVLQNTASVGNTPTTNSAKLEYYTDPNHSGTGTTNVPDENPSKSPSPSTGLPTGSQTSSADVYTTAIMIKKTNSSDVKLTGATFELVGNGVKDTLVSKVDYTPNNPNVNDQNTAEYKYYKLTDGTYTDTAPSEAAATYDSTKWYKLKEANDEGNYYVTTAPDESSQEAYDDTYTATYVKYKMTTSFVSKDTTSSTSITGSVDADGNLIFKGLGSGTYTLKETKAPAGYNKIDDIEFTITFNPDYLAKGTASGKTALFTASRTDLKYQPSDGYMHITIINYPGKTLPNTGGIGTTIFYAVGTVLVLGAGIALVVRRRMRKEASEI
jgi:LPXTG-motif cell wall-anchored protein